MAVPTGTRPSAARYWEGGASIPWFKIEITGQKKRTYGGFNACKRLQPTAPAQASECIVCAIAKNPTWPGLVASHLALIFFHLELL